MLRGVLGKGRQRKISPMTLVFQALLIAVNKELEVIEKVLPDAIELLRPCGRLGVIAFHSLEDRIVKRIFRFAASDKYDTVGVAGVFQDKTPTVRLLTRKAVVATDEEIADNPRCRSAKARFIEKI